jgi:hypothetical protein
VSAARNWPSPIRNSRPGRVGALTRPPLQAALQGSRSPLPLLQAAASSPVQPHPSPVLSRSASSPVLSRSASSSLLRRQPRLCGCCLCRCPPAASPASAAAPVPHSRCPLAGLSRIPAAEGRRIEVRCCPLFCVCSRCYRLYTTETTEYRNCPTVPLSAGVCSTGE